MLDEDDDLERNEQLEEYQYLLDANPNDIDDPEKLRIAGISIFRLCVSCA